MLLKFVEPDVLKTWLHDGDELALFDVREQGQYGAEHLLFAVSLPYSRLEKDIGRLAPRRQVRMVLVDQDETIARKAAHRLAQLGYDRLFVLRGGNPAWRQAGHALFAGVNVPSKVFGELVEHTYKTPRVTAGELSEMMNDGRKLVVLDGRPYSEYRKMNIPGAICCPNGELAYRLHEIVPDEQTPIVINCAGRTRSIIGAQTLLNLGVKNPVYALENGTQGWFLQDMVLENNSARTYPEVPNGEKLAQARTRAQALAARFSVPYVDAEQVAAWLNADSQTVFVCDVRTEEEYLARTLPGAQHTPGGQLIQATDHYIGVRGARVALFDDDGVRAPVVASWLRQLGHDAYVLNEGVEASFDPVATQRLQSSAIPAISTLPEITAMELEQALSRNEAIAIDVRSSAAYRRAHIAGSIWSIRPRVAEHVPGTDGMVIFVADDPAVAALAASELGPDSSVYCLHGGLGGWKDAGYSCESTPGEPADSDCIDYLFFVHDRHDGNKEAARQYLAWELGLLERIDEQDRQVFTGLAT